MKNWKETVTDSIICEKNYLAFQAQELKKSKYWRYLAGGVGGMNEFRHNQKGIALITVIIIITVVSVSYAIMIGKVKTVGALMHTLTVGIADALPLFIIYIFAMQLVQSIIFVF